MLVISITEPLNAWSGVAARLQVATLVDSVVMPNCSIELESKVHDAENCGNWYPAE